MKNPAIYLLLLIISAAAIPISKGVGSGQAQAAFAVVELFTSEGCSSCPPADEAVAKLEVSNQHIFVLGFHVDYWNNLGWKDPFSNSLYSKRQQQYAAIFGLNSVYTPQIIINGNTQFVGSDETKLRQHIQDALKQPAPVSLHLQAVQDAQHMIQVNCTAEGSPQGTLAVALIQDQAASSIRAGENSGKLLHHINIVRDFKTAPLINGRGSFSFSLPAGLSAGDCQLIAFLQQTKTGNMLGAIGGQIR